MASVYCIEQFFGVLTSCSKKKLERFSGLMLVKCDIWGEVVFKCPLPFLKKISECMNDSFLMKKLRKKFLQEVWQCDASPK